MIKEKLLVGGGGLPYTHVITVGIIPYSAQESIGYSRRYTDNPAGNLNPNTVNQATISTLSSNSSNRTTRIAGSGNWDDVNNWYIARSDTGVSLGKVRYDVQGVASKYGTWDDGALFSSDDLNKEIPIWLSTTPPPWI